MSDTNELAFIITPRSDRVFTGASVVLDLEVENRSRSAVSFPNPMFPSSPQPVYTLRRPDGEEIELTPHNLVGNGQSAGETGAVTLVTLEADEGWEGDMSLERLTDLSQPGAYELTGRITWEGLSVESKPVTITVLETRPEELSIALGIDDDGSMFCEGMLLQRSPDTLEAVAALLKEVDPRLGEMNVTNYIPRGPVPRSSRVILGTNANYVDLVLRWTVAKTGEGLFVANNAGDRVCNVTCDQPIAFALPPLTTSNQSLTLLAISSAPDPALWYAKLGNPEDLPATASMKRIADLTSAPLSTTSVLGPDAQGSPILVVTTTVKDNGTTLDVYPISDDGAVRKETREFPDVRALPGIGGHVDAHGHTLFGFLAIVPGAEQEQLAYVEVRGKLDGNLLDRSEPATPFERVEITGEVRVKYYERSPGDTRRAVAYQTETDSLYTIDDDSLPRSAYSGLPRHARWGIAPGRDTWYVVFTGEGGVSVGPL